MLTPQEVLMHAQAMVVPGKRAPAMEGSYDCYPCRVAQIGEVGTCEGSGGALCARHETAVAKLMKSSFTSGRDTTQALIDQRRALLTAVVAVRERNERSGSVLGSSTSSFGICNASSLHSLECSSDNSDSGSDTAIEDEDLAMIRSGHSSVGSLPWRGVPRLPTVMESDEEMEGSPRAAAFSRT